MTLRETTARWTCISTGCASASLKSGTPLEFERSAGWATVWRCAHEAAARDANRRSSGPLAAPPDRRGDGDVFLDKGAVFRYRVGSSSIAGHGDHCGAERRVQRANSGRHDGLYQLAAACKAPLDGHRRAD